jgi:hypothetical protein
VNAAQGQRMEFTKEDRRMLAWLRYQHENWRIKRLFQLAASLACCLWGLSAFISRSDLGIFLGITGFYILSRTIGSWHGKPEISLLLKLIDERQEKERPCGLDNCCKHKQNCLRQ